MKKVYSIIFFSWLLNNLVAVGQTTHTAHYAQHVVVGGVDTNLGSLGALNRGVGQDKLQGSVVNSGEVARARRLVLLGAQGERVDVNARVRGASVVLVGLDQIEVGALTLREAVLAVKHKLSSSDRVGSPAVHIKGSLGKYEGTGIRYTRVD